MKLLRASLIAIAFSAVSVGFGYSHFNVSSADNQRQPAACARCGDGVCAKSCENALTCPQDCGGVPSAASR